METEKVDNQTLVQDVERVLQRLIKNEKSLHEADPVLVNTLFEFISSEDEESAKISTRLLFTSFVEPLLDSFTAGGREIYYRVFSSLLKLARVHPEGRRLDGYLNSFGLKKDGELLARKNRVLASGKCTLPFERIKKVLVLSRVTIGADVAITSIIVEKAKLLFPDAKIILIGSAKMGELFFDKGRVEIIPVRYHTETFFTRLGSVVDIHEEISPRMDEDSILLDPDSRFTQLGLLPLLNPEIEAERYFFYESTVKEETPSSFNVSVNKWIDTVFDVTDTGFGGVFVSPEHIKTGETFFRENGLNDHFVVTANFGVGGNDSKRVGGEFERALVALILSAGVKLLLDEGFGEGESERIRKIKDEFSENPGFMTFKAGIGEFASLIKKSSLYIGYDSMGQHVAAACSIPEIIIFKGYHNALFPVRWAPVGKNTVDTILANGKSGEELLSLLDESLKRAIAISGMNYCGSNSLNLNNN